MKVLQAMVDMVASSWSTDGAAHKQIWGCKEDAGIKYCILCANIRSTLKHNQVVLTTDNKDCSVSKVETGRWQSLGMIPLNVYTENSLQAE